MLEGGLTRESERAIALRRRSLKRRIIELESGLEAASSPKKKKKK
jgi:protein involved in polysaccharide export with SLBB domain